MDYITQILESLLQHWFKVVVASSIVVTLYFWGTRHSRQLKRFSHLRGPKPWPVINNLPDAIRSKGQLHVQLNEYYKKYGKLFVMTSVNGIVFGVSDPEMIKQILVKDFDSFRGRQSFIKFPKPLDKMLSNATGETWSRVRNTISPSFSAHKMRLMIPLMNQACDNLLKKLDKMADKEESLDVFKCMRMLTLDIILSSAFGIQSECQANPDDPIAAEVSDCLRFDPLALLAIGVCVLLPYGTELLKFVTPWLFKNFHGVVRVAEMVVKTAKQKEEHSQENLLDLMVNAERPDSQGKKLTEEEIVAQCIAFLLGGYETTSTTLSLICYCLATNPSVQERLQEEIDSVWTNKDEVPSYDNVRELTYLDMVISETLRLYPNVTFISRECTRECKVKGLTIPKDASVFIPVYSIHHDPAIWPDPETYDPERFSPVVKKSRDPYFYLPFGNGPRNCIGLRFAYMEMKLVLVRILKKYTVQVAADTVMPPRVRERITLTVDGGIKLKVTSRH